MAVILAIVGVAAAQYEAGHVKILQDKRYQEGAAFGNYRNQEDGIKYQEETDQQGIRRGYWEYPDETGKILRVEFEAGAGIGFRITNSNYLANSLIDNSVIQPRPAAPVQQVPRALPQPVHHTQQIHQAPQPIHQAPQPIHQAPLPVFRQALPTTTTPRGPINLFDYPASLDFSRHSLGHSFKFTAN
ncbi:uncharacterized protein LOC108677969 isoform X2 [Hyalella azteca]|uniref:Uncharacterized protein LOC108677969 isoform X2 n=1 Tax=Hyalella azteca TaxID=294128 RepID=A0A979FPG1_HYAAZ|nr:uncharacterized protein LOC108677969 isoform X2 [Hyalella azteca]